MSEPIDLGAELVDYGTPPPTASVGPPELLAGPDYAPIPSDGPRLVLPPQSIGRLADMQDQGFAILPDTTPLRRPTPITAWLPTVVPASETRCHQCQRYLPDGPDTCSECPPKLADIPVPDLPFAWKPHIVHGSPKSWHDIRGGGSDD